MEAARNWDKPSEPAPNGASALADKHHLPLVDLGETGVDGAAVRAIALPVLNRAAAIPFETDGGTLKIAITDPGDVRALDELRLATRQTVEFHVAAEEDILTELRRLTRAAGAHERRVRRDGHPREARRRRPTTSRPRTASRRRRSSASSTR